jgi:hypothetical protein
MPTGFFVARRRPSWCVWRVGSPSAARARRGARARARGDPCLCRYRCHRYFPGWKVPRLLAGRPLERGPAWPGSTRRLPGPLATLPIPSDTHGIDIAAGNAPGSGGSESPAARIVVRGARASGSGFGLGPGLARSPMVVVIRPAASPCFASGAVPIPDPTLISAASRSRWLRIPRPRDVPLPGLVSEGSRSRAPRPASRAAAAHRGPAASAAGARQHLPGPRHSRIRPWTCGTPGGGGSGRPRDRGEGAPSQAPTRGNDRCEASPHAKR